MCQPWWCKGLSARGSQHGIVWHPYQRLWNRLGGVFLSAKMISSAKTIECFFECQNAKGATDLLGEDQGC